MSTERWDIEANAIMYFNSVSDARKFTNPGRFATLNGVSAGGITPTSVLVGACVQFEDNDPMKQCLKSESPAFLHGKNHFSLRLGGDYNILPGVFTVRGGVSYETDGAEPRYTDITNYMLGRTGLHVGATLRIARKTDITIGFVHFIQKDVRLTPNLGGAPLPRNIMENPDKYHLVQGENDGEAGFPITDSSDPAEGPLFANAGSYYYHLDVIALDFAQHF
jgi:long-subunit fatty acid transport protein